VSDSGVNHHHNAEEVVPEHGPGQHYERSGSAVYIGGFNVQIFFWSLGQLIYLFSMPRSSIPAYLHCDCLLELGRAAAKKGLAINPILAAGGLSEMFFTRNIMSHRTSTLINQFYSP
jgi:hypothetical protein